MSTINLAPDSLVTALSEPGVDPDYVTIAGWVGEASDADTVRIYTTQALDEYLEFSSDAVVHREQGTGLHAPSTVWIRATHEGTRVQTAGRAAQIAIMNGDMTNAFLEDDEVAGFALETSKTSKAFPGPIVKGSSPTVVVPIISASIIASVITVAGVDDRNAKRF